MELTFRWYGPADQVTLAHIRQIPAVRGIVTSLPDVAPGDAWSESDLAAVASSIDQAGLRFAVVESVPVHEDIKLGRETRDRLIDNWCASIERIGAVGVPVVCYNFMPVFDWMRTSLALSLPDGSTTLAYDDEALHRLDLSRGTGELPGWAAAYDASALAALLAAYAAVTPERLWENLEYFLERVVPVAESAGVKLAIHPDDPPWPIFDLPRIITDMSSLRRLASLVDRPANGVTFCTGSFGALPTNDLPAMIRDIGARGRIHFAHCRNVRVTGERAFNETAHPTSCGDVNMYEVLRALHETEFAGPMRPDHGRMIWDERGRPGYGLYDRALGAMYLHGLWEGIAHMESAA
jgi:mannonate dehydratase